MQTTLCFRATDVINNGSYNNRPYSRRGNNHQVISTISRRRVNNSFHLHDIVIVDPSSDHALNNAKHPAKLGYGSSWSAPGICKLVVTSLQTILSERDIPLLRRLCVINKINTITSLCVLQIIEIPASLIS